MKRMHDLTIGPESLHDAVFYKGQQFVIVWIFHLASSTNKVRYLNFTGPNFPIDKYFLTSTGYICEFRLTDLINTDFQCPAIVMMYYISSHILYIIQKK